jgi:uncharacterized protein involved in exopolysaccharide biosynthesis
VENIQSLRQRIAELELENSILSQQLAEALARITELEDGSAVLDQQLAEALARIQDALRVLVE